MFSLTHAFAGDPILINERERQNHIAESTSPTRLSERTKESQVIEESTSLSNRADRKYLAELVEGVATLGDEHAIRSLLANFSYIPRHDDYLDHLRGILLGRLADLATRQPMVAENHFHLDGDVGQFIARGNGYISEQKIDEIRRRLAERKEQRNTEEQGNESSDNEQ